MFRPQIQKTRVLFLLALINMILVYWALNSYELNPTYGYSIKKKAANIMETSINSLREEFINKSINKGKDTLSFGSFLIGPKQSAIQTTTGSIVSKQATLNPNFAAMITEMLMELEIKQSNIVAISYTGSFPGANIAILAALEALNVQALIISSCGASEYGATHEQMNWIDIENYLFINQIISNRSQLASIGGGHDLGTQLGTNGKKICESSIYSNQVELLNVKNPNENINKRINYYENSDLGDVDIFINVGGGIFTIGDSLQRKELPPGIIYPGDINSENNITVIERFLNKNVPVININNIHILSDWYDLPYPINKDNKIGMGSLFYSQKQYHPKVILTTFIISSGAMLLVGLISHREIKKRMQSSEPESIL